MTPFFRVSGAALVAALAVSLAGCGTIRDDDDASYFMVSTGRADGLAAMFTGEVEYCKVTQSNLGDSEYAVSVDFDGTDCTVEAIANDKAAKE